MNRFVGMENPQAPDKRISKTDELQRRHVSRARVSATLRTFCAATFGHVTFGSRYAHARGTAWDALARSVLADILMEPAVCRAHRLVVRKLH
jgi:hypothetical protein